MVFRLYLIYHMFDLDHKGYLSREEVLQLSECVARGLAFSGGKNFKGSESFRA